MVVLCNRHFASTKEAQYHAAYTAHRALCALSKHSTVRLSIYHVQPSAVQAVIALQLNSLMSHLTKMVILPKVTLQIIVVSVVLVQLACSLAQVAGVVLLGQVLKQVRLVIEASSAELTARVPKEAMLRVT
jgi:hypothetical protein